MVQFYSDCMGDTNSREVVAPLRVLIADPLGEALSEMLEDYDDIEVVGYAKKCPAKHWALF